MILNRTLSMALGALLLTFAWGCQPEPSDDDDIYIADAEVGKIRRIDAVTGIISTVVGTGIQGYTGDGGPATEARIGFPTAIRFDGEGNLYFSDKTHNVVRKVAAETGVIETVLGVGEEGYSPDGTPALEARLGQPYGMEVSADGRTIFVSDTANCRVRAVNAGGKLTTLAGSDDGGDSGERGPAVQARLNYPCGLRLYGDQILLICDLWNNRVKALRLE